MTDSCVVVIRTKNSDDILAILNAKVDDILKIEHPYFAKINPTTGNVVMVPFCPLSDEKYFEISTSDISFMVTASDEISGKFVSMVLAADKMIEAEQDPLDTFHYSTSQVISGNNTKH